MQRRAYSLVEMLVVIVILGIAGAMLVPTFGQTDTLRVQSAVRTVVSDITIAQSDSMAFQRGCGVQFTLGTESHYVTALVNGNSMDTDLDRITSQTIAGPSFGNVTFSDTNMTNNQLIFDEMGSPVRLATGQTAPTQWIDVNGQRQTYRITVEAYTGRVIVAETRNDDAPTTPTPNL
jgi:prepilin-type N-terminal cleavage/methylation domain-containing protein